VLENRESRERQYALAEFAQRLGWPAERVVVIDEDQGQSGKTAAERSGFQRLTTEVSLNHVGMVLGLELSRLSRSNKDWHQLIDVCGIFNVLLCDQDAVYDPLDSNDRLLLGMRGAMSEYELVTLRNRYLNAYSQIDVQLKRRHDLIPNLVEAVKGYMAHERQTLERVIQARNAASGALASADPRNSAAMLSLAGAESALVSALGQLMALKESYPNLKADQNAARLMEELSSTENRVAFARQAYNDAVMLYNTARQRFPNVMLAGAFGFAEAPLFQIENASERDVVNVQL
jgi:LemA protein